MIRILIDENLPRKLKFRFTDKYEMLTVGDLGWNSKKNGELLGLIETNHFDYFLTADQNIEYQQNLNAIHFSLIILEVSNNRYELLQPLIPKIIEAIESDRTSKLIRIS